MRHHSNPVALPTCRSCFGGRGKNHFRLKTPRRLDTFVYSQSYALGITRGRDMKINFVLPMGVLVASLTGSVVMLQNMGVVLEVSVITMKYMISDTRTR